MRVRGKGRMLRTLSRVALIGIIGGAAAACSSDASRLSNPFSNPFDSEPAATGSLPDGGLKSVPPVRTGRIQSEALSAPGAPRSASVAAPIQPHASAPATRVASTGQVGWNAQGGTQITVSQNDSLNQMSTRYGVPASAILSANGLTSANQITPGRQIVIPVYNASGMNPAAAPMTARPARAAEEKREDSKQVDGKLAAKREEAAREAKREEAKREEAKRDEAKREEAKEAVKEAAKRAADKETERKEALARDAAARKVADTKSRKETVKEAAKVDAKADDKPRHVRPGQVAKADEKKPDPKADAKAKAEAKAMEAKAEAKAAAKAEATQKLAEAKAAKEAAQKAAAAEKVEKVAAKEAPKAAAPAAPAKPEPAATGSVADASESFRWPAKGRVISGYGTSGNEGINIAVPEGTPVKAAEEGTVAYAGSDVKGYGKLVLVRHANGYVSAYAHNGELDVKPGEKVKRGQVIAKSGASGNVTSPQLHFEIRKGGAPVDPMSQLASN
ncbi:peptidoglycan DD-metalloendopeptidase family protein [Methylobacterium sp. E-065]|uniref:peptidoglycan DD-metalloendopeptidase family protein n=1 Tax=Methylobacterium sp. E-065 TaxID=2836583 RepID=UPI001FBA0A02|nr:peptidoglycan DD-metalloendopeptidase family protein [Methylobacterium sp. E-065]MCJ2018429.1 peptidoglycan DD-metalloendopeptidase family protein [Methylobacterium sp. E-065]